MMAQEVLTRVKGVLLDTMGHYCYKLMIMNQNNSAGCEWYL